MPKAPPFERIQRQLGRRIRAARIEAELTQEEAAGVAGIDYKRWQRLEAGKVNATVRTLARAAQALNLTVWELLGTQD